ncbi:MAG: hypothetical protein HZA78_10565 [Candidatus Schekmanbacteria bacterium]|nr:hypothetical protein [Candidatus Schekmanbacteria bacterium]
MYTFIIKQGMLQFSDYVQRDLDCNQTGNGIIAAKVFAWNESNGGLVLGIEPMGIKTYYSLPIQRGRMSQGEGNRINKLQITLGDIQFKNSQLFLGNPALIKGAKLIVRRTMTDLDLELASSYRLIFRGYVSAVSANEGNIQIEVAERYYDWSRPLNKRMFSKVCNFVFKSVQCGYNGTETWCDKTLTRCSQLNNQEHFGGFPDLPGLQFARF